jgi:hypothetical protein
VVATTVGRPPDAPPQAASKQSSGSRASARIAATCY